MAIAGVSAVDLAQAQPLPENTTPVIASRDDTSSPSSVFTPRMFTAEKKRHLSSLGTQSPKAEGHTRLSGTWKSLRVGIAPSAST